MRSLLTPRWMLSHLFVAFMVALMVGLAFWQLERLDDRKVSNDEIRLASEAPPATIEALLAEIDSGVDVLDHTAVTVEGLYRPDLQFLVANRTFDTAPGSWVAMPVELADGSLVVVSRGWVPRLWVAGKDPRTVETPTGTVRVQGRLFHSVDGGRVGSGNDDFAEVSRIEIAAVEEALGVDVVVRWVQLIDQSPANVGDLPVPVPPPTLDDGPHLSYAFQWFFFSAGAVTVYALILRRRLRDGHQGVVT